MTKFDYFWLGFLFGFIVCACYSMYEVRRQFKKFITKQELEKLKAKLGL